MTSDARQFAPATERNRQPILTVLQKVLPPTGMVLEISSGTGQHAIFFAPRLKPLIWLPSELTPEGRESIQAWRQAEPSENLLEPITLDVMASPWPVEDPDCPALQDQPRIQAIVNINMIHIAPWEACLALMAGAGRILPEEGVLYLYGPYKRNGMHTAPSNEAFDQNLKERNSDWGVRDLEGVIAAAEAKNLWAQQIAEMPANNLSVVFRKGA